MSQHGGSVNLYMHRGSKKLKVMFVYSFRYDNPSGPTSYKNHQRLPDNPSAQKDCLNPTSRSPLYALVESLVESLRWTLIGNHAAFVFYQRICLPHHLRVTLSERAVIMITTLRKVALVHLNRVFHNMDKIFP